MKKLTRAEKQRAIANTVKRSMNRLNDDADAKRNAENFGECEVGIVIEDLFGRLGDFHGVYTNGSFKLRRKLNEDKLDALVTVTEEAFMKLVTGEITPQYALGTSGIIVTGEHAYQIMVVGVSVGDLLYNVLNDK